MERLDFAIVIAHDDAFEAWDDFRDGGLVDGVREVSVAGGGAFEEHHEAVGESVAESFRTIIDAPREVEDAWDLFRESLDDVPNVGDVFWRAGVFELKKCDMFGSGGHGGMVRNRVEAVKPDLSGEHGNVGDGLQIVDVGLAVCGCASAARVRVIHDERESAVAIIEGVLCVHEHAGLTQEQILRITNPA